jgi:hypothetical protein
VEYDEMLAQMPTRLRKEHERDMANVRVVSGFMDMLREAMTRQSQPAYEDPHAEPEEVASGE